MRFASLGSGSEGNGLVVQADGTRLLLDCGFGVRDTVRRLARLGIDPADLSGILVTHEHSDHASGVFALARQFSLGVWLTHGTLAALREDCEECAAGVSLGVIQGETEFSVEGIMVRPYTVPHDAREPVQFVFSDGARSLAVLTDIGCATPLALQMLSGRDALVLEANHDLDMLWDGDYPQQLKARIAGRYGHLDNQSSAGILSAIDCGRLKHLVAAHLSRKNNTPALARAALAASLGCADDWITAATQETGFDWLEL